MNIIELKTTRREELVAITRDLRELVRKKGWQNGAILVYSPHTTAGFTINENADPDVATDIRWFMNKLVPNAADFEHAEGNSDAHVKTTLCGPHVMLIVQDNELQLGTWQGVYFCEWDGPRNRNVWVQFLPGE